MLRKAGFVQITGKGSHSHWIHPLFSGKITLSGKEGSDAKLYHEKKVNYAIQEVDRRKENEEA
jgi:predicted RNA binding protein YcfA (HicA-like mRNA interferase family)